MKRPLGIQGGTGQGHGSQRWLAGRGGGLCGRSTKEKQVEGGEREGRRGTRRAGGKLSSSWFLLRSIGGGGGRIIVIGRANASMAFAVCQTCPHTHPCKSMLDVPQGTPEDLGPALKDSTA